MGSRYLKHNIENPLRDKKELERLFTELADVSFAKRLTSEIIKKRAEVPITKVGELKAIIQSYIQDYIQHNLITCISLIIFWLTLI